MQVKLAVLADFASISREGKLNIMGIFDEINPQQLPVALPIFYVVLSFDTRASEFDTDKVMSIVLQDEDGGVMLRIDQPIHVPRPPRPGTRGTVNGVNALVGLPFERAGNYEFDVMVDGHNETSIRLRVNQPQRTESGGV
ncbi:MAG: DUF6941 family protein [Dehalococcoidia bacterium]